MIEALTVDLSQDLRSLSQYLYSQRIPHRISEQTDKQIVWVEHRDQIALVEQAYARLSQTQARVEVEDKVSAQPRSGAKNPIYDGISTARILNNLSRAPVISVLLLTSIVLSLLMASQFAPLIYAWLRMGSPAYVVESGEYWRLLSPVFLHFNTMHLAFNMLLFWVLGQRMELKLSSSLTLLLIVLMGVASNLSQYWVSGSNFGGMSGVIYGMLGFCWLWDRLEPKDAFNFPPALMGLMLLWLVLGFTGMMSLLVDGNIANTAHLSGLLAGLALAPLTTVLKKRRKEAPQNFR